MHQGRLFIKNQHWSEHVWINVFRRVFELTRTELPIDFHIKILYIENCTLSDSSLAQLINLMIQATKIKRVILVKMVLGPNTIAALKKLNKNKTSSKTVRSFSIDFRDCKLEGFDT